MVNINNEYCSNCGGKCCKKSGCDYFVEDFEVINKASLMQLLDSGNVSIVATLDFRLLADSTLVCRPFLYLRVRNVERDVVDLFSFKRQCSMLSDTGCLYSPDKRPSGGLNLIPNEDNTKCRPERDIVTEIAKWEPYQNILGKLVKRYTGMSVDERFRQDVEQVFVDIFNKNFEGVAEVEIEDMLSSISHLAACFKEEYHRALKRCNINNHVLVRK